MNRSELEQLLLDIESDRVERTISVTDTEKYSEAICAFSNDLSGNNLPGYLFVAATEDGKASGAVISDQLLQNLAAIRSDGHIQPLPTMNVQKWPLGGGEIAIVEVLPSTSPPVRYKGRTCIRVGPRRGYATPAEERLLSERRIDYDRTWDARVAWESSLSDLSLELFAITYRPNAVAQDVIDENDRPIKVQLASLRFFDLKADNPNNAAIFLFGKNTRSFIPGAYVQYVQYAGTTQADDVVRERVFQGDLLDILRGLDRLAQEIAESRPVMSAMIADQNVFDYPPRAMHEIFMNAMIHRNYDGSTTPVMINHYEDRVEVQNPGGLYGDLTIEQFPNGTSYRNPILAEAAKVLGFVNRFGRGVSIIQAELKRNGSPSAVFQPYPNYFLVTIGRHP